MILLIDPQFGDRSCDAVAGHMDDVQVWPASTLHREIGIMQANQVLASLKSTSKHCDTAIGAGGTGFGAGPAAGLVRSGQAKRAILVDPAIALTHDVELTKIDSETSYADYQQSIEKMAPFLPELDKGTYFPSGVYRIFAEELTPDPDLQGRLATIWQQAEEKRQPYDQTIPLQPDPESSEELNWLHAWMDSGLDVTVWLSANRARLADPLRERAPGRPLVIQPWDALIWLSDPVRLAHALTTALS